MKVKLYLSIKKTLQILATEIYKCNEGLLPFQKKCFICFNESPLKMMKNVVYFILKALWVYKIFRFLL